MNFYEISKLMSKILEKQNYIKVNSTKYNLVTMNKKKCYSLFQKTTKIYPCDKFHFIIP